MKREQSGRSKTKRCTRLLNRMQRTLLQALALLVVSTLSANAMPPGWTKGCSNPVYGSPDAACAVALEQPGSFYIADTVNGVCRFFNADGASIGQQFICPSCPSGFHVDANSNCSPNASFAGLDPFANVGSGAQSALTVSAASAQPLPVDDSINAATGNKYEREVDYEGAGPFPLTFVRYYNSQFTYQSQLGLSWRHNYDRQVLIEDASHVVVVRPEGQAFEFVLSNGSWASVNDPVDRLQSTAGGWVLINQADEIETYTASGQLTSITNRAGLTQTLFYSDAGTPASIAPQPGLLIKVTGPAGRELRFAYDLRRLLQTMRDAAGNLYTYSYNRQGSLTQVSYPGSASARIYRYAFAGINPFLANTLTGIVDESGNDFATFGYDTGTARAVSSKLGGALSADPYTLKYNSNGTTSITDAFTTRVYGFQSVLGLAHLSSVSQPCTGCSANFAARAYDASGFVASSTDFNGNLTTYQRNDPFSRPDLETARTEAVGKPEARTITTEWEATWCLPRRIAEPLRITSFTYDSQGNVLSRTVQPTADANGAQGLAAAAAGTPGTWTYAYSYSPTMTGLITQLVVDGPRTDLADTTTYAWDSAGNLISVTNALGHVTTFDDYDAHGRPRQIVDANGLVTTLAYDQRGRLIARDAGGEHTGYAYDAAGQLKTITLPGGSSLAYTYDAAHRLTQVQDNAGNRTVYTLDALGNRIAEQVFDPNQVLARTRSRELNSLNRLVKDIGGTNPGVQVTRYNYDLQGNAAASTDPLGNAHAYLYDALHRLIQVLDPAPVGTGAGGSTQYTYDGLDQLTLITDARGLATSYTVDGSGNLTRLTSPDTGLASSAYDAAGNLMQRLDTRGVIGRFTYDALNRITQAVYTPPTGSDIEPLSISYSYDQSSFGVGRLSGITDSSGSIALAYDVHGRLASETRTIVGVAYTTSYTYDASGRLIRLTYPSGRTVDYTLNALERIQQIDTSYAGVTQPLVSAVTYQPFGAINGFTFGNAQGVSLPRDLDGRLISYPIGGITRTLTYDAASRISAYRHADPLLDQTFEYDNLNRLGAWTATSGNQRYGYDPVGNRTTLTIGAVVYNASYAPTSNRLVNGSFPVPFDYQYDEAGSTRRDALRSYSYDAGSRLTQVSSNGVLSRFTFNALGQRVMKAPANGLPRVFHYDAGGRLIAESTVAGDVLREYVYLGELPVAMLSSDHDDDGVPDARDNCILDPNPDQTDTSASGYGNVCNGDANGDGVVNQTDLNLAITLSHRVGGASTLAGKRADMNADGVLNAQDQALISQWIKQRGVPGPSGLRSPPAGPELFYIYADQIGTPRALIDATSNKVRWQWQVADPFGIQPPIQNPQSDFISLPFNLRFPGQYYDRETGLHHGIARDYDPTIARYIEPDPLGLMRGVNLYTYAGTDPVSRTDPARRALRMGEDLFTVKVPGIDLVTWPVQDTPGRWPLEPVKRTH